MMHSSSNKKLKQQKVKPKVRLERKDYVLWLFTFNVSNHQDECVIILQMDGLARPGTRKPGGQGTCGPVGLSTCWPGGASTHESGGAFIREPGGPSTHELGGLGTCGPGGLSSRDLLKSFTRSDTSRTQPIQKGQSYNWLQNEENRNSFSSCQSPAINHGEEDDQEDTHEIDDAQTETDTSDDELEDNIGSTSHDDNYMYWPSSKDVLAKDDLIRFRHHWTKGEIVIFRHVLEQTSGLSWEPMVIWCALCEHVDPTFSSKMSEVKTIDCLRGCKAALKEENISIHGPRCSN
nr:lysine-specific demethylase JMJ25-like [Tanacetum cinerariifolium]